MKGMLEVVVSVGILLSVVLVFTFMALLYSREPDYDWWDE
jgi:hypothetical protein